MKSSKTNKSKRNYLPQQCLLECRKGNRLSVLKNDFGKPEDLFHLGAPPEFGDSYAFSKEETKAVQMFSQCLCKNVDNWSLFITASPSCVCF